MFYKLFIILCCAVLHVNATISIKIELRHGFHNISKAIHYGRDVLVKDYPYMVQVFRRTAGTLFRCGGTLIAPKCILTAAHCVNLANGPSDLVVATMSGFHSINKKRNVTKFIIPKWYNAKPKDGDISILVTDTSIKSDEAKIVELDLRDKIPKHFSTLGWGRTADDEPASKSLRIIKSKSLTEKQCLKLHRIATKNNLCAEPSCMCFDRGDSGGPAISMENNKQIGIVSWFANTDKKNGTIFVYTRLGSAEVSDFVKKKMSSYC